MSQRSLAIVSFYYLYIPLAIFLYYWIIPCIAIPLAIILGICPIYITRRIHGNIVVGNKKIETIVFITLFLWTLLSGIGGYVWQNRWDHLYRNAVFLDLTNMQWPVNDGLNLLVYYFGFWLPSALVSKLTGYIEIGWCLQFAYGLLGIYIAFRLTIQLVGNIKYKYLLPFILFSGIDILFFILFKIPIREDFHIELWSELACWESNTTLIYWVYNQAIPAWVATMLIINYGKIPGLAPLIICFLLISAPFPAVGLFPLALFYQIQKGILHLSAKEFFKSLFNWVNIISLLGAIPVILFFSLNSSTGFSFGISDLSVSEFAFQLIWLLFIEVLIFIPFIFNNIKRSPEFFILFLSCFLFLFIQMGNEYGDFNGRVELPLNYFLTFQLILFLKNWMQVKRYIKLCFLLISSFAIVTPGLEISRILYQTIRKPHMEYRSHKYETVFQIDRLRQNFVADSILYPPNYKYPLYILNLPTKGNTSTNQE